LLRPRPLAVCGFWFANARDVAATAMGSAPIEFLLAYYFDPPAVLPATDGVCRFCIFEDQTGALPISITVINRLLGSVLPPKFQRKAPRENLFPPDLALSSLRKDDILLHSSPTPRNDPPPTIPCGLVFCLLPPGRPFFPLTPLFAYGDDQSALVSFPTLAKPAVSFLPQVRTSPPLKFFLCMVCFGLQTLGGVICVFLPPYPTPSLWFLLFPPWTFFFFFPLPHPHIFSIYPS